MNTGEVRAKLLDPSLNKIINHPTTLVNIWFINRISAEQVSIEIFLFSTEAIANEQLNDIMASELLSSSLSRRIDPKDCYYWFYRYYCEIFLNENLFTASSGIMNCVVKGEKEATLILHHSGCPEEWDSSLNYIFGTEFASSLDN